MTHHDLIAAFETLAEAPDGVKRLRELVLHLAVRGKLVPQDAGDEPANVLLRRIKSELSQHGGRPRAARRSDAPSTASVEQFVLPPTWAWSSAEECTAYIRRGKSPTYDDDRGTTPVVSQKCVQWSGFDLSRARFIEDSSVARYDPDQFLRNGDILWNSTGLGTLGRVICFIESKQHPKIVADSHVTIVRPLLCNSRFLWCWFAGPVVQRVINHLATGSTKQTELATKTIEALPVPLPPLAEQHRIVARVDELMSLLDRLEAARTTRDDVRRAARDAALAALRDAEDTEAVEAAWGRIAGQMDALFAEPEDVAPLRQAVLQLAVRGRLTGDDESNWLNTTLGSILVDGPKNGWSPKAVDYHTGVMSLKLSATTRGYFDGSHFKHVDPEGELDQRLWLRPDDLLIQRSNTPEYVGVAAVFDGPPQTFIYPDLMMRCRVSPEHNVRFVHLAISAPSARAWISAKANGTSQSMVKVNQATVAAIPIRLPTEDRQRAIFAAASRYFQMCDTLEARLTAARELHAAFAAAAVHHLDL